MCRLPKEKLMWGTPGWCSSERGDSMNTSQAWATRSASFITSAWSLCDEDQKGKFCLYFMTLFGFWGLLKCRTWQLHTFFFFFFPKKFSEFHLGKHFLSVIPLECKLHEKNFQQFSSLLYFQHLEQCLANSRHLISICWINKWMNQCFLNKFKKHGT